MAVLCCALILARAIGIAAASLLPLAIFSRAPDGSPFSEPSSQDALQSDAGCSTENSWIPGCNEYVRKSGLEYACFGVWTTQWSRTYNQSQLRKLNAVLSPELKSAIDRNQCPYGSELPGQVTWPDPPAELQGVVAALDLSKYIAVIYSYIPYFVGLAVTVHMSVHVVTGLVHGTPPFSKMHLFVVGYLLLLLFLLEVCLKQAFSNPRPGMLLQGKDYHGRYTGSCVNSCGMPSSHAALGMSWFMLIFLDAVYKVQNRDAAEHQRLSIQVRCRRLVKLDLLLLKPWVDASEIRNWDFLMYILFWGFLLIPVPFMRVVLKDHTESQVLYGMFFGVMFVLVWRKVIALICALPQPAFLDPWLKDDLSLGCDTQGVSEVGTFRSLQQGGTSLQVREEGAS